MSDYSLNTMPIMPIMPNFGFPNMCDPYSSKVFMNDMTGFNSYVPPFNSYMMPGMSMDESLFNCNPYGMTMPYMGGFNMDSYYKQMVEYQQKSREADQNLNASLREMRQSRRNLEYKIASGEQEQILPAFQDYVESVSSYYGDKGTYEEMKNTALDLYEQQTGKSLQNQIRENDKWGSFGHGLKQVGLLGFGDNISAEQNIAKITGQPEGKTESLLKTAGNATAGAVYGLATGLLVKGKQAAAATAGAAPQAAAITKVPLLGKLFKSNGSIKVKAALAIGAAVGWLFGKILDK